MTFDPPRGSLVFTVGADEDVGQLTRLLLPEAPPSAWAPPLASSVMEPLWPGDEEPQMLLRNPTTHQAPEDVQWD